MGLKKKSYNTKKNTSKKFIYLDHTADVMFESYGSTIEEAFSNSAMAMFNILTDIKKVKPVKEYSIKIKSNKIEKLLFDFLDNLLFYLDTEHIIFSKFDISIKKDKGFFNLNCKCYGDNINNYDRHGDIKAPTYNEMLIKKKTNKKNKKIKWIIRAVVDI